VRYKWAALRGVESFKDGAFGFRRKQVKAIVSQDFVAEGGFNVVPVR